MAIDWAKQTPDSEIIITCSQDRPGPAIGFRGLDMGVEEMYEKLAKARGRVVEPSAVCSAGRAPAPLAPTTMRRAEASRATLMTVSSARSVVQVVATLTPASRTRAAAPPGRLDLLRQLLKVLFDAKLHSRKPRRAGALLGASMMISPSGTDLAKSIAASRARPAVSEPS